VCRKSYVNPDVFVAWRNGSLHRIAGAMSAAAPRRAEALAIVLLERCARSRAAPGPAAGLRLRGRAGRARETGAAMHATA
jgi:hypothetical protein